MSHRPSITLRLAFAGLVSLLAACEEFAPPAELSKPQVLAVRVASPSVAPGQRTRLEILVAGPEGEIASPAVTWTIEPVSTGAPLVGSIEEDDDGTYYRAPDSVEEMPTIAAVRATVRVDGEDLVAVKAVAVTVVPLENPTITALTAGEEDALAAAAVDVAPGEVVPLAVEVAPAITEDTTFAWYSTAGEIERYLSNPTELVAPMDPGEGWLFAVVRDGLGGVTWARIALSVR